MAIDPSQLAGGGAPQGVPPQVAQGVEPQGVDQQVLLEALQQAIQASVDEQGFVDLKQMAIIWPQIAQQLGINIPFETVMQMIQQNPEIVQDLVVQMGLSGIIIDGRQISADELAREGNAQSPADQQTGQPISSQPVVQGGI